MPNRGQTTFEARARDAIRDEACQEPQNQSGKGINLRGQALHRRLDQLFERGRIEIHVVTGNRQRKQEVAVEIALGRVRGAQDPADESRRLLAAVLRHAQPAGAEEDRLPPSRIVQVGMKDLPTFVSSKEGQAPAREVLLEGEVEESEGVVAAGDEEARHLSHFAQEAARVLLGFAELGNRGGLSKVSFFFEADLGEGRFELGPAGGAAGPFALEPESHGDEDVLGLMAVESYDRLLASPLAAGCEPVVEHGRDVGLIELHPAMRELAHLTAKESKEGEHEGIRRQPADAVVAPDVVQEVPLELPGLAERLRRRLAGSPRLVGVGPAVDEDLDLLFTKVKDAQGGQAPR